MKKRVTSGCVTVSGFRAASCFLKSGSTLPLLPSTFPKRTAAKVVLGCFNCSCVTMISARRFVAPMTLLGRTDTPRAKHVIARCFPWIGFHQRHVLVRCRVVDAVGRELFEDTIDRARLYDVADDRADIHIGMRFTQLVVEEEQIGFRLVHE